MSYDIGQSRNNYNEYCSYWNRDERDIFDTDEYVYKRIPTGHFWAKEITPEVDQDNIIDGAFNFEKTTVTIKSVDNLLDVQKKAIVKFRGEIWFVQNVQKRKARIQNTFFGANNACSHYWYLELRK